MTTPERFWAKVHKSSTCWVWTGSRNGRGYGTFVVNGKSVRAHRFSYESEVGEIPEKYVIDHLCRNTSCVRPAHLEAVTHRENVLRGLTSALRPNFCKQGHEFTPENTYPSGIWRMCKKCQQVGKKRRYQQRKLQHHNQEEVK